MSTSTENIMEQQENVLPKDQSPTITEEVVPKAKPPQATPAAVRTRRLKELVGFWEKINVTLIFRARAAARRTRACLRAVRNCSARRSPATTYIIRPCCEFAVFVVQR